ncbi:CARDB domain-containing protein [Candidatus Aenigmatarchaeota archaeon]
MRKVSPFGIFVVVIIIVALVVAFFPIAPGKTPLNIIGFDNNNDDQTNDIQSEATGEFSFPIADVIDIEAIDITLPDEIHAEQELVYKAKIKNNIDTPITGFTVEINFGDESTNYLTYSEYLPADESITFDFPHVYTTPGEYEIKLIVTDNRDEDLDNNEISVHATVLEPISYTHLTCIEEMCLRMSGIGDDQCTTEADCVGKGINIGAGSKDGSSGSGDDDDSGEPEEPVIIIGDLSIFDIVFEPENATNITEVIINVVVKNVGNTYLEGSVMTDLYYNDVLESEQPFDVALLPDEEATLFMDIEIFDSGTYEVRSSIDPSFTDTNPLNNVRIETINVS